MRGFASWPRRAGRGAGGWRVWRDRGLGCRRGRRRRWPVGRGLFVSTRLGVVGDRMKERKYLHDGSKNGRIEQVLSLPESGLHGKGYSDYLGYAE